MGKDYCYQGREGVGEAQLGKYTPLEQQRNQQGDFTVRSSEREWVGQDCFPRSQPGTNGIFQWVQAARGIQSLQRPVRAKQEDIAARWDAARGG